MKFATKLTILLLTIVTSSSLVLSYLVYISNVRTLEEEIKTKMEYRATLVMDTVDRFMYERMSDIVSLSTRILYLLEKPDVTPRMITEDLIEYRNVNKNYVSLSYFDINRVRVADTSGTEIGQTHLTGKYWEELLKGEASIAKHVELAESLGVPVIFFAIGVKNDEGKLLGAIVARVPVAKLYEITRLALGTGKESEYIKIDLVNKDGLLLYSNYNRAGMLKEKGGYCKDMEKILAGKKSNSGICSLDNSVFEVVAKERGYLDFAGNGWTLILTMPRNEIFAPAIELRNKLVIVAFFVMILSIVISLTFARSFSQPLIRLSQAADKIGHGDMSVRVDVR